MTNQSRDPPILIFPIIFPTSKDGSPTFVGRNMDDLLLARGARMKQARRPPDRTAPSVLPPRGRAIRPVHRYVTAPSHTASHPRVAGPVHGGCGHHRYLRKSLRKARLSTAHTNPNCLAVRTSAETPPKTIRAIYMNSNLTFKNRNYHPFTIHPSGEFQIPPCPMNAFDIMDFSIPQRSTRRSEK